MAVLLEEIGAKSDPKLNGFLNARRAAMLKPELDKATTPIDIMNWRGAYAIELLHMGRTEDSIEQFSQLMKEYNENPGTATARNFRLLRGHLGTAYLRLGEQENCISNHTSDSCLLPIQQGGVYKLQRGPRTAIKFFEEALKAEEQDTTARWLLNISYMTIGEYPTNVPPAWRLAPKVFASDYDIKRFKDVAGSLGLDVDDLAGGTVVDDFDGDGYLDVIASAWGFKSQIRFFRNNANGTFTQRTEEAGLIGVTGGLNLVHADYNNDGFPDVLVLRGAWMGSEGRFPSSLLRNNGNGTFTDVTEEAGLLRFRPTQTAVWLDYDGDGFLDLFFGAESMGSDVNPCLLFHNERNGTFVECGQSAGLDYVGFVKGVVSADYNNDGRPDLYVSGKAMPNRLYRNDGPAGTNAWKFTEVAAAAGVTDPFHSFTTWFFDYDQDGWEDIFVCGYDLKGVGDILSDYLGEETRSEKARLFRNNRDGTFKDVTKEAGLFKILHGMGANFGDLDNDGWPDFYIGTGDPAFGTLIPNRMLRNNAGKTFQDVTTSGGFGHLQKGHAVSFADLDNDGDQDIYSVIGGAYEGDGYRNVLFENPGHGNHWLSLKLEGVKSNRSALGARIKVTVEEAQGSRTIHKTVSSGGSFGGSPLRQQIGLGQARSIREVEIYWPASGKKQLLKGLSMDRTYKIREDENQASALVLKSLKFPSGHADGHQHHH